MRRKLYLANPYGFSPLARAFVLEMIKSKLEFNVRVDVFEPFSDNEQAEHAEDSGYIIGRLDKVAVKNCDGFFGVVNGNPPDEGVMVELGMAIALKKPTFLFRDDFREYSDSKEYPLNLMLFTGMPKNNWQDYYYTSITELDNPNKALMKWAKGEL